MSDLTERARAALEGVTPGPWEHRLGPPDESPDDYMSRALINDGEPLHVIIAPSNDDKFAYVVPAITGDGPTSAVNAEFIAAAPTLVFELIAEVKRLESLRDEANAAIERVRATAQYWVSNDPGDPRLPQALRQGGRTILAALDGDADQDQPAEPVPWVRRLHGYDQ